MRRVYAQVAFWRWRVRMHPLRRDDSNDNENTVSLARFWRRRAREASREVGDDGWVNNPYDKLDEMGRSGTVSVRFLIPVAPSLCTRHLLVMDKAGRVSCTVCGVAFRTGT